MTHFFMVQPSASIAPGTPSAVQNATQKETLHVFPNPANETVRVDGWNGNLVLHDLTGKRCKSWSDLPGASGLHLSVGDLPNGVYVLRDETGSSVRVLIQH